MSFKDHDITDILAVSQLGPYPTVLGLLASLKISDKVAQPVQPIEIYPSMFAHAPNETILEGCIHEEFREDRWAVVLAEDDGQPIPVVDAFCGPFQALNLLGRYVILWSSSTLNVDVSKPGYFLNTQQGAVPMNNVCVFKSDTNDNWFAANTAEDLDELTTVFDLLELSGDALDNTVQ